MSVSCLIHKINADDMGVYLFENNRLGKTSKTAIFK